MKRNNVRLLTDAEIENVKSRFVFRLEEDKIAVDAFRNNRTTYHPINESFSLNIKNLRKITFTLDAINIWLNLLLRGEKPNLLDVQQATNKLVLSYQPITLEKVKNILVEQKNLKIKEKK